MRRGHLQAPLKEAKGKFELANHGTLFLDEIGDVSSICTGEAVKGPAEESLKE